MIPDNSKLDAVIRKIAGLMRLAEKAGTEEEQQAAAGMAQKLMDEYSIESSAIDMRKDNAKPVITGKDVQGNHGRWAMMDWKIKLISWIADLNGVTAIRTGRREIRLFGKADKIQIVEYLTMYLCREVERLAIDVIWPERGIYSGMIQRTWVQHFGIGAAVKLHARMKREREAQSTAGQINALVLADKAVVDEYVAQQFKSLRQSTSRRKPSQAMNDGYEAADSISWNKGLGDASAPKQIK